MEYSFNIKGENFVYAQSYDVNASYKHLGAVCDAVRYAKADQALDLLDIVMGMEHAIPFRRHNKHMGSRSELGGQKGAYPVKAAYEVKKTLVNAIANASNKGLDVNDLIVVHACANKTHIENRYPSKGSIAWGRGMYGRSATNHSNLEYTKIEIVLAEKEDKLLTSNMKYFIKKKASMIKIVLDKKKAPVKKAPAAKGKAAAAPKKPAAPKTDAAKKELPKPTQQTTAPEPKTEQPAPQTKPVEKVVPTKIPETDAQKTEK